jgi:phospholipase/carboxylesterase
MADYLPAVELNPLDEANAAVIWLHGLGADGHDFEGIVPQLGLPPPLRVRFVFPHAPEIAITINRGNVMRGWFDILEPGKERSINSRQLLLSSLEVHKLIDREIERGINSERILLAGFSQGGAVCYQAGLTYDKPLAGLLALSTWFPTAETIELHPANASLPIEIFHGTLDPVLALWMAENSVSALQKLGLKPNYTTYPMPHSVCAEEVSRISEFISSVLA